MISTIQYNKVAKGELAQNVRYHEKCLISDSTKLIPLKGYEKDFLVKSLPIGFVFSVRIPSEQELIECYQGYSRDDYLSPITKKRHYELLEEFEPYRKTGKLLDIGCGIGHFLTSSKEKGWDVYGTEYTDKAVGICQSLGIKMHKGKLDPAVFQKEMFDVVTSFEVLEHINNPKEEVQNIRQILRPGGLFYFTTPNFNALERYALKGKYNIFAYPEHLSYYTKKTINYLLSNNGFQKKKLRTTGISLTRIKSSLGKKEEFISADSNDEKVRQQFETNSFMQFVKNSLNSVLSALGVGNSLKGWYVRK